MSKDNYAILSNFEVEILSVGESIISSKSIEIELRSYP